jgi:hypothetical protein
MTDLEVNLIWLLPLVFMIGYFIGFLTCAIMKGGIK